MDLVKQFGYPTVVQIRARVKHLFNVVQEAHGSRTKRQFEQRFLKDISTALSKKMRTVTDGIKIVRGRFTAAISANALGQAVTIVIQLFTLPIFLISWNAETYGKWIVLSAIPSYLGLTELGMIGAATNAVSVALSLHTGKAANSIYQTSVAFTLAVTTACCLIVSLGALFMPIISDVGRSDALTLALLSATLLVGINSGMLEAGLRAVDRYSTGVILTSVGRLVEWLCAIAAVSAHASFVTVALIMLLGRVAHLVICVNFFNQMQYAISWGVMSAHRSTLPPLLRPAASFSLYPIIGAAAIQGTILAVGFNFGNATVGWFSAYRTYSRVIVQLSSMVCASLWSSFARLWLDREWQKLDIVYRSSLTIISAGSFALGFCLLVARNVIFSNWTQNAIPISLVGMSLMVMYAFAASVGNVPRTLLFAVNKHERLAIATAAIVTIQLVISAFLGVFITANGIIAVLLLAESAISGYAHFEQRRVRR